MRAIKIKMRLNFMSLRQENEKLKYKAMKQQEDIDYLREVIADLKLELIEAQSKKKDADERSR